MYNEDESEKKREREVSHTDLLQPHDCVDLSSQHFFSVNRSVLDKTSCVRKENTRATLTSFLPRYFVKQSVSDQHRLEDKEISEEFYVPKSTSPKLTKYFEMLNKAGWQRSRNNLSLS